MKLVAFSEKPDKRAKDMDDFLFILENYCEIAGEQLFEGAYEDLIEGDFEMGIAAAKMLGRHMAVILNKNDVLKERVIDILNSRLKGFNDEEINQMYNVRDAGDSQVQRFKLILEVINGIID